MQRKQNCDETCYWCATDWWRWLRAREAQMRRPREGETVPFSTAMATSIRPSWRNGQAHPAFTR